MQMGNFRVTLRAFVPAEFGETLPIHAVKWSHGRRDKSEGKDPGTPPIPRPANNASYPLRYVLAGRAGAASVMPWQNPTMLL